MHNGPTLLRVILQIGRRTDYVFFVSVIGIILQCSRPCQHSQVAAVCDSITITKRPAAICFVRLYMRRFRFIRTVFKHPAIISTEEIGRFSQLYRDDARPNQPFYDRVVLESQ